MDWATWQRSHNIQAQPPSDDWDWQVDNPEQLPFATEGNVSLDLLLGHDTPMEQSSYHHTGLILDPTIDAEPFPKPSNVNDASTTDPLDIDIDWLIERGKLLDQYEGRSNELTKRKRYDDEAKVIAELEQFEQQFQKQLTELQQVETQNRAKRIALTPIEDMARIRFKLRHKPWMDKVRGWFAEKHQREAEEAKARAAASATASATTASNVSTRATTAATTTTTTTTTATAAAPTTTTSTSSTRAEKASTVDERMDDYDDSDDIPAPTNRITRLSTKAGGLPVNTLTALTIASVMRDISQSHYDNRQETTSMSLRAQHKASPDSVTLDDADSNEDPALLALAANMEKEAIALAQAGNIIEMISVLRHAETALEGKRNLWSKTCFTSALLMFTCGSLESFAKQTVQKLTLLEHTHDATSHWHRDCSPFIILALRLHAKGMYPFLSSSHATQSGGEEMRKLYEPCARRLINTSQLWPLRWPTPLDHHTPHRGAEQFRLAHVGRARDERSLISIWPSVTYWTPQEYSATEIRWHSSAEHASEAAKDLLNTSLIVHPRAPDVIFEIQWNPSADDGSNDIIIRFVKVQQPTDQDEQDKQCTQLFMEMVMFSPPLDSTRKPSDSPSDHANEDGIRHCIDQMHRNTIQYLRDAESNDEENESKRMAALVLFIRLSEWFYQIIDFDGRLTKAVRHEFHRQIKRWSQDLWSIFSDDGYIVEDYMISGQPSPLRKVMHTRFILPFGPSQFVYPPFSMLGLEPKSSFMFEILLDWLQRNHLITSPDQVYAVAVRRESIQGETPLPHVGASLEVTVKPATEACQMHWLQTIRRRRATWMQRFHTDDPVHSSNYTVSCNGREAICHVHASQPVANQMLAALLNLRAPFAWI